MHFYFYIVSIVLDFTRTGFGSTLPIPDSAFIPLWRYRYSYLDVVSLEA